MIRSKGGFTLAETMIAIAVSGFLILVVVSVHGMLFTSDRDDRLIESVDEFELRRRIEFDMSKRMDALVAESGDSWLKHCYADACDTACAKEKQLKDWRGIHWGPVLLNWVKIGRETPVNEGAAYRIPAWSPCIAFGETKPEDGKPFPAPRDFPKDCYGRARAHWRMGSGDTLEFLIDLELRHPSRKATRELRYFIPRKLPEGGYCIDPKLQGAVK